MTSLGEGREDACAKTVDFGPIRTCSETFVASVASAFASYLGLLSIRRYYTGKSMTHCRVPPEPSVRARARNERYLFHSIGRCVQEEERQRPHTTHT
ncbi:hypothetical protein EVAR_40513_1 [Eumeta japonica]|uniref:Uncharacterized protein n=1 Tax=Eumeta variegata TaxID=151549 RepID=A0A4C1XYW2_EUMVA|nr:hypothetical protein EVAR_40513_1 [Eumeta japonica]